MRAAIAGGAMTVANLHCTIVSRQVALMQRNCVCDYIAKSTAS
jgi:hypothetical protein